METQNYIIAGGRGGDPATLSFKMEPVRLESGMGVAIKSIVYGEIYNITAENNRFHLQLKTSLLMVLRNKITESRLDEIYSGVTLIIRPGRYNTGEQVMIQLCRELNNYCRGLGLNCTSELRKKPGRLELVLADQIEYIEYTNDSPLKLIDAIVSPGLVECADKEIGSSVLICFAYLDICVNSYINGKRSRVLNIFPLECKRGYNYFEFAAPTYIPIEIREFRSIEVTLRDVNGQKIGFCSDYNTVINLHVKKIGL